MTSHTLRHGDSAIVMRSIESDSVDSIVTDPPYGISVAGASWDKTVPGSGVWVECLRALRPGGLLLSFGGARTYHRMASAVEDAGFDIRDMLAWVYGTGFPKSRASLKPAMEPVLMARKPGGKTALRVSECRVPVASGDGRWPANLIHDGSDHVVDLFPPSLGQRGKLTAQTKARPGKNVFGDMPPANGFSPRGDSGSAARFFYCAKPSPTERGEGNNHPTVKPVALMRYLVRLVTASGGLCLDPFMGSGTTGVACLQEGIRFFGIDNDEASVELAKTRIGQCVIR